MDKSGSTFPSHRSMGEVVQVGLTKRERLAAQALHEAFKLFRVWDNAKTESVHDNNARWVALAAYVIKKREIACLEASIEELIKISPPHRGDMTTEEECNFGTGIMYRVEELRLQLTDLKGSKDDGEK